MALRLSTASQPNVPARPGAIDFAGRAQACLLSRDLAGYRALFVEAAELEDVHRRYKARVTLTEQALAAARRLERKHLPALYATLARSVVELLEEEPREPVLVNLLGVALYELDSLRAAEELFRAARRLDPELPHVERNLREVAALRRGQRRRPTLPPDVVAVTAQVAKRALQCAARAKPATGLTLSLCMIVKDEQEMLPRCLEAVAGAVDEIVIVDTGSSDRTVEIAESFGARVLHHEWTGSFAEARNVSIDAASGDWLMYLDADEVLVADDAQQLRALTGRVWREAFFLVETNFTGELEDGMAVTHNAMRVWRKRPQYRFEGRLHEQFAHQLPGYLPERLESTSVRVEHYGYLGVVRDAKEKTARNIALLEQQAADGVDTPFQAFNLGSEYGAIGDERNALAQLEKAWRMLEGDPQGATYPYVPSLVSRYVKALRCCGELERAERQADEGLELFPGFTDLVFEQACCARDRGELRHAVERLESCLEMGDAPARYSATVGCGSYLALVGLAELHERLGDTGEAERLLEECLTRHPGFLGTVYPLAALRLRRGAAAEDVTETIERGVREPTPNVRFMLGTALYEAGHPATAEYQFRLVVERQPSSGPARVALAEALLSLGRLEESAQLAAAIESGNPCAPAARRTELFARLVSGDLDGADGVLSRRGLELPAAETEIFAAWHQAMIGGPLPPVLPTASADLLVTVLEALLRLRAVKPFALLVPLVERVGLPARERRERLASIYLRRGFLDSAADEWIAVCEEQGPDVNALIGLAQVALGKQLSDDALNFARGARQLSPDHKGANSLVEHLEAAGQGCAAPAC